MGSWIVMGRGSKGGVFFYTGKAGMAAYSQNEGDAFAYGGEGAAVLRAANLTRLSGISGITWGVWRLKVSGGGS